MGQAQANQALFVVSEDLGTTNMMLNSLSPSQCQQLITFLSSQLQHSSPTIVESQQQDGPSVSSFSGKLTFSSSYNSFPHNSWILDTGATHHVCCSLNLFNNFFLSFNSSVTLPTSEYITITRIGLVELFNHFTLENVLYVPQFRFNLILISALTQSHCCFVKFEFESCFIQDRMQRQMIGIGRRDGNLYVLDPANLFPTLAHTSGLCNNVSKTNHEIWHTHLSHPSYVRLNMLKNILNFKHIVDHSPHCSICHLAKQKWLPIPISNFVSQCPFDLLHMSTYRVLFIYQHMMVFNIS